MLIWLLEDAVAGIGSALSLPAGGLPPARRSLPSLDPLLCYRQGSGFMGIGTDVSK